MNDELGELLEQGRLTPVDGCLIGRKLNWGSTVDVAGLGVTSVKETRGSGLVVVDLGSPEEAALSHTAVVVLALGKTPARWRTRFLNVEFDHRTSWAEQKIEVGTVVYARGVAQAPLGVSSEFVQLRYDDLAGIGAPLDQEGGPDVLPAPGFVLVKKDEYEDKVGSLYVDSKYAEVLEEGAGAWGTIVGLARGDRLAAEDGLAVGTRIGFPRYQLTEYVDLEGGLRLLPLDDVLMVDE